jgi:hypothetical protein
MTLRIIALLVGVIVLSIGISATFNINFVALFAGLFVFLKSFKLKFLLQWIGRFLLVRLPQRVLTAAVKLYIIDRDRMHRILAWFTRQQLHWRTHYRLRLIIFGIIGIIIAFFSAWQTGLWLLVIYEIEVVAEVIWRKIWPTLSENLFIKSLSQLYDWLRKTRLGRFIIRLDHLFEQHFRQRMEHAGKTHQQRAKQLLEEALTYQLKSRYVPPPKKVAHHRHLVTHQQKKFQRGSVHTNRRRHYRRPKH